MDGDKAMNNEDHKNYCLFPITKFQKFSNIRYKSIVPVQ